MPFSVVSVDMRWYTDQLTQYIRHGLISNQTYTRHGLVSVILHTFVSNIDLHTIVSMLLLTTWYTINTIVCC